MFELTIFVFAKILCVHVDMAMIDPHRTDAVVRFSVLWLLQDNFLKKFFKIKGFFLSQSGSGPFCAFFSLSMRTVLGVWEN